MIVYFEEAIRLLLGNDFFTNYTWADSFFNIAIFTFSIIILFAAFKLFKWLIWGWWH